MPCDDIEKHIHEHAKEKWSNCAKEVHICIYCYFGLIIDLTNQILFLIFTVFYHNAFPTVLTSTYLRVFDCMLTT